MKIVGIISLFIGWFGAVVVGDAIGGYVGQVVALALFFIVGAAHQWTLTGKI